MNDFEKRRENAQGRPTPVVPYTPFPLVGVDVSATPGIGFEVTDVLIRNPKTDPYGVGIELEISKNGKWIKASVSWLNVGVEDDKTIGEMQKNKLLARIWCHEDFKEANVAKLKSMMVDHVAKKIDVLQSFFEEIKPPLALSPKL